MTFYPCSNKLDYVKYIMISGKSQENGGSYYNSSYVNVSKHNNNSIINVFMYVYIKVIRIVCCNHDLIQR